MPRDITRSTAETLRFDRWTFHRDRMELRSGDEVVRLQPLVMALLEHFLAHPGRVISKDELLKAVWRSPHVTDSAVTRAVMKLRQSLGGLVTTVHRVGYRFDATVSELGTPAADRPPPAVQRDKAATGPMAILRFIDARGRDLAEGRADGLACWLHLVCEQAGLGPLLPMNSVLAWSPASDRSSDVAAACAALGAATAIGCRLTEADGQTVIEARWGGPSFEPRELRVAARNAPGAVVKLVEAIGGASPPDWLADEWSEELVEAFMLERQGKAGQALGLMAAWKPEALRQGPLLLMRVRLLRMQGLAAEAELAARQALAAADLPLRAVERVGLLNELTAIANLHADFTAAETWSDQALALIEANPSAASKLADALVVRSVVEMARGQQAAGVQLTLRALDAALADADPATAMRVRLRVAVVLNSVGRHAEALHHAHLGTRDAEVADLPRLQGFGYTILAVIHNRALRVETALEFARKAVAFSAAGGDRSMAFDAWLVMFSTLVRSSRLDEASAALPAFRASEFGAESQRRIEVCGAWLLWRQGRREEALRALAAVFDQYVRIGSTHRWDVGSQMFHGYLSLGRRDDALRLLDALADDPMEGRRVPLEAALALFDADRKRCVTLLRRVWSRHSMQGPYLIDNALNLAWLLLEDGEGASPADLWRQVREISPEYECARLVQLRHQLWMEPGSFEPSRWRSVVLSVPGLAARHPQFADIDDASALTGAQGPKLAELLTNACW